MVFQYFDQYAQTSLKEFDTGWTLFRIWLKRNLMGTVLFCSSTRTSAQLLLSSLSFTCSLFLPSLLGCAKPLSAMRVGDVANGIVLLNTAAFLAVVAFPSLHPLMSRPDLSGWPPPGDRARILPRREIFQSGKLPRLPSLAMRCPVLTERLVKPELLGRRVLCLIQGNLPTMFSAIATQFLVLIFIMLLPGDCILLQPHPVFLCRHIVSSPPRTAGALRCPAMTWLVLLLALRFCWCSSHGSIKTCRFLSISPCAPAMSRLALSGVACGVQC